MKVAYVVYNERPSSGLMRTQVIALIKEIVRRRPGLQMTLISIWQPWVARRHGDEISALTAEMAASGIRHVSLSWALIPTRHFAYRAWLFPLLRTWVRIILRNALRDRFDVVHCRGYLPSFGAAECKPALGHRLVFDMRSLWPREHVTIGAWKTTDRINRQWEDLERRTTIAADATIGVSPAMVDDIRDIDPRARAQLVPICVDLEEIHFDAAARERLRAELGWQSKAVIVYQGSLGLMNSNLSEVAELLAPICQAMPEARFLILTSNRGVDVASALRAFGIDESRFAIRHPAREQLREWMSAADAGIHAMSPGPDSATRLGVKIVEYLACGLPIIVNPHVGAAARLVREQGVGVVLENCEPGEIRTRLLHLFQQQPVPAEASRGLATRMFSLGACAERYLALYEPAHAESGVNDVAA
jgi:glycosyltransferase involved in cell wall biosynthesis